MKNDIEKVLFTEEEIAAAVERIGNEISEEYRGKNPMLIGILRGASVFMSDLMRKITIPCEIDFISVSSYGNQTESTGQLILRQDISSDPKGRDIILIDDILDSGMTIYKIKGHLLQQGANSVSVAVILDKPDRRKVDLTPEYIGLETPNYFVVGYGLDYQEKYRNLPYIGVLKPELYS